MDHKRLQFIIPQIDGGGCDSPTTRRVLRNSSHLGTEGRKRGRPPRNSDDLSSSKRQKFQVQEKEKKIDSKRGRGRPPKTKPRCNSSQGSISVLDNLNGDSWYDEKIFCQNCEKEFSSQNSLAKHKFWCESSRFTRSGKTFAGPSSRSKKSCKTGSSERRNEGRREAPAAQNSHDQPLDPLVGQIAEGISIVEERPVNCPNCKMVYKNELSLQKHLKSCTYISDDDDESESESDDCDLESNNGMQSCPTMIDNTDTVDERGEDLDVATSNSDSESSSDQESSSSASDNEDVAYTENNPSHDSESVDYSSTTNLKDIETCDIDREQCNDRPSSLPSIVPETETSELESSSNVANSHKEMDCYTSAQHERKVENPQSHLGSDDSGCLDSLCDQSLPENEMIKSSTEVPAVDETIKVKPAAPIAVELPLTSQVQTNEDNEVVLTLKDNYGKIYKMKVPNSHLNYQENLSGNQESKPIIAQENYPLSNISNPASNTENTNLIMNAQPEPSVPKPQRPSIQKVMVIQNNVDSDPSNLSFGLSHILGQQPVSHINAQKSNPVVSASQKSSILPETYANQTSVNFSSVLERLKHPGLSETNFNAVPGSLMEPSTGMHVHPSLVPNNMYSNNIPNVQQIQAFHPGYAPSLHGQDILNQSVISNYPYRLAFQPGFESSPSPFMQIGMAQGRFPFPCVGPAQGTGQIHSSFPVHGSATNVTTDQQYLQAVLSANQLRPTNSPYIDQTKLFVQTQMYPSPTVENPYQHPAQLQQRGNDMLGGINHFNLNGALVNARTHYQTPTFTNSIQNTTYQTNQFPSNHVIRPDPLRYNRDELYSIGFNKFTNVVDCSKDPANSVLNENVLRQAQWSTVPPATNVSPTKFPQPLYHVVQARVPDEPPVQVGFLSKDLPHLSTISNNSQSQPSVPVGNIQQNLVHLDNAEMNCNKYLTLNQTQNLTQEVLLGKYRKVLPNPVASIQSQASTLHFGKNPYNIVSSRTENSSSGKPISASNLENAVTYFPGCESGNEPNAVSRKNPIQTAVVRPLENPLQKLSDQISQIESSFNNPNTPTRFPCKNYPNIELQRKANNMTLSSISSPMPNETLQTFSGPNPSALTSKHHSQTAKEVAQTSQKSTRPKSLSNDGKPIMVTLERKEGGRTYSIKDTNMNDYGDAKPKGQGSLKKLDIKSTIKSGDTTVTTYYVMEPKIHIIPYLDPSSEDLDSNITVPEDQTNCSALDPVGRERNMYQQDKNPLSRRAVVVYQIKRKDAENSILFCSSDVRTFWCHAFELMQGTRHQHNMPPLSYPSSLVATTNENKPFTLTKKQEEELIHKAVQFLLENLPNRHHQINFKQPFLYYNPPSPINEEEGKLNESGSARCEVYSGRKPFDMFGWLASRHRKPLLRIEKPEEIYSYTLPLTQRYRNLKVKPAQSLMVMWSTIHGRGLYTRRDIERGEMVIEYTGEVIRTSLCEQREKYYEAKGIDCYLFRIDDVYVIDATMMGNAARFINHSCEPNCESKPIVGANGKKHIVIVALRKISSGEELTYDYKFEKEKDENKIACKCRSKRCKKFLN